MPNGTGAGLGLYWLASYPKSGNTWMRAFLAGLVGGTQSVDINALGTGEIASSPSLVEEILGFEIGELSQDEIDMLRPHAYRFLGIRAARAEEDAYHKIHDAYTSLPDGSPLIPADAARGTVYIVRNPLDVVVSFAHHSGCDLDRSIRNLADPGFCLCGGEGRLHDQLRQKLLTWSGHVRSWLDAPGLNRLVIRYEDMRTRPMETFTAAARFLGLSDDASSVARALAGCSLEDLQKQERDKGFREKVPGKARFFRRGVVGDWVGTLSAAQVEAVVGYHGEVMAALGYLDAAGRPVEEFDGVETVAAEAMGT